tara:strand:+ start:116 stop:589 length:474 start_codon:yes stop_codon:yes gene_type:complete
MSSLDMLNWHDARSEEVTLEDILNFLSSAATNSTIHVGCDSHFVKNNCIYAVVIAVCTPGKGGTWFFARKKFKRKNFLNMKLRLLKEVENCLEIADLISSKTLRNDVQVHLDINPNKLYKSSLVFTSATSWVKSQGYECIVKPDAWASSCIADTYAK